MSGSASERVAVVTASARSLPALICSSDDSMGSNANVQLAAHEIGQHRRRAAIGHVHDVDAGHHLEQLASHVLRAAVAGRPQVELAGIGLGVGDELGHGPGRHRRIHVHDERIAHDARNRRDIADEIEAQLVIERRIDGIERPGQQEGVAVGAARPRPPRCRCCRPRRAGSRRRTAGRAAPTATGRSAVR